MKPQIQLEDPLLLFQHRIRIENEIHYGTLLEYKKTLLDILENHISFCGNLEIAKDSPQMGYLYPDNERVYGYVYIKAFLKLKPPIG